MNVFERLAKPKPPKGYSEVKVEFTQEESEFIGQTLRRYADVANEDAPEGKEAFVPKKAKNGMIAQGLTEYVEDLRRQLEDCESSEEKALLMDKSIRATMKAYAVHNLPVYLFQAAKMLESIGDTANAKNFFKQFLQAQSEFEPDKIDISFLNQIGLDIPEIVAMAREKAR